MSSGPSDIIEFLMHFLPWILGSLAFLFVLNIVLTIFVYRDAKSRGTSPLFWAAITFIFSLLGVFIYIIIRPPAGRPKCARCGSPLDPSWKTCPKCSVQLPAAAAQVARAAAGAPPQTAPAPVQPASPAPAPTATGTGPGRAFSSPTIADEEETKMPVLGWVVGLTGEVKGKRFDLIEGENSIGRDTGAHVCVNNPKVSTRHARIIWTGETFSLEDLGSTNGTFLNELPIKAEEPQILENSDEIRLGKEVRLKFIKVTAEP